MSPHVSGWGATSSHPETSKFVHQVDKEVAQQEQSVGHVLHVDVPLVFALHQTVGNDPHPGALEAQPATDGQEGRGFQTIKRRSFPGLYRRAGHGPIRAENATIPLFGFEDGATVLAPIEVLARTFGHALPLAMATPGAGDNRFPLDFHAPLLGDILRDLPRVCRDSSCVRRSGESAR